MFYEYVCNNCPASTNIKRQMSDPEVAPVCSDHGVMRRLYTGQSRAIVCLDAPGYINKALAGEELPAGMTQRQVQQIVHGATAHKLRGRANARHYKTLR